MSKRPRIGLVEFLGSNCDQDCIDAFARHFDINLEIIWHSATELPKLDGLILPGGFSYGDFLRSGALASHTKIMAAVKEFAKKGGAVLGICNGFQILTESHLLPGALLRNQSGKFICSFVDLETSDGSSLYHARLKNEGPLRIPVAHGEGRYYIDEEGLKRLREYGQIAFTYKNNPNGSLASIAGITSVDGRILGMMPHPERATSLLTAESTSGLKILKTFLECCVGA